MATLLSLGAAWGRVGRAGNRRRNGRKISLIRPEVTPMAIQPAAALQRLLLPLDGTPTTAALLAPATALASRLAHRLICSMSPT